MMLLLLISVLTVSVESDIFFSSKLTEFKRGNHIPDIRYYKRHTDINCHFRGYWPGGNVTEIGKVKAPKAVLAQKDAMSVIMSKLGQQANIIMHSMNAGVAKVGKEDMAKYMKGWAKLAPKLAPCLGIFGAVVAAYGGGTSTEDILESTNKAIGELATEIDSKMEDMKGYVATKITTLERHLIQRDVRVMMRLLSACLDEPNEEFREECIREAYATLSAYRPKFTIFDRAILQNKWINLDKAREVEAYLPSFHIYANFVLMTAKTLVEMYNNTIDDVVYNKTTLAEIYNNKLDGIDDKTTLDDKTTIDDIHDNTTLWVPPDNTTLRGRQYYRYKKQLHNQLTFFRDYATNAVDAIIKANSGKDGTGPCLGTIDCKLHHHTKNWWRTITNSQYKCKCMIEDATKQWCETTFELHTKLGYTYKMGDEETLGVKSFRKLAGEADLQLIKRIAKSEFTSTAEAYQGVNELIIREHWNKNLLDTIPNWNKAEELINDR